MYVFAAKFNFKCNLNDFLPEHKKFKTILYEFNGNPSIKASVEAIGVPHTEVDLILVNGCPTGFDYHLKNRDCVAVYPDNVVSPDSRNQKLRNELFEYKFILDVHLGKLGRLMRMAGFDVMYNNSYDDPEIEVLSVEENRIVLTRDRKLLKRRLIQHGYWVRSTDPNEQIKEVIRRFKLVERIKKFHRCIKCNGIIKQVEKNKIVDSLEPLTRLYFDEFYRCYSCKQVYWKGSHYEKMNDYIRNLWNLSYD
jgi:uncharacterized protein